MWGMDHTYCCYACLCTATPSIMSSIQATPMTQVQGGLGAASQSAWMPARILAEQGDRAPALSPQSPRAGLRWWGGKG